ncbi:unnamed protein product [Albugo candida]|uniref:Protein kinase domain-containing protein n=1 Tax=Albugo candida TaxID=65357 RepID=A0A024GJZ6_9STRA|nr:unnamed protein product [Albugo candida]|eukprot:CCI47206.1 unnamed protein product [Albugo candida]
MLPVKIIIRTVYNKQVKFSKLMLFMNQNCNGNTSHFSQVRKCWQCLLTMRRFLYEAERLENATWRIGSIQKRIDAQLKLNSDTLQRQICRFAVDTNYFDGMYTHEKWNDQKEAKICVYCESADAILSCSGCCHDVYCAHCFKIVHKKGFLATHTAIKINGMRYEPLREALDPPREEIHSLQPNGCVDRASNCVKRVNWELRMGSFLQQLMQTSAFQGDISVNDITDRSIGTHAQTSREACGGNKELSQLPKSGRLKSLCCANCGSDDHNLIDCAQLEETSELDGTYRSTSDPNAVGKTIETSLRKYFTTIHNEGCSNSTHAFLGDEMSVHGAGHFDSSNRTKPVSSKKGNHNRGIQMTLEPIAEKLVGLSDGRNNCVLIPILQGMSSDRDWMPQHWLLPSLAQNLPQDVYMSLHSRESVVQTVVRMTQLQGCEWQNRCIHLQRNILWEYLDDNPTSRPIAFANLCEASVQVSDMDTRLVEIVFFQFSSSQSAVEAKAYIEFLDEIEAENWKVDLDKACHLTAVDLFQTNTSQDDFGHTEELGRGRFSTVCKSRRKVDTDTEPIGQECALKIIDKIRFWELVLANVERPDTMAREILTQTVLTARADAKFSPVIRLQSLFETRNELILELELMSGGDLHDEIVANTTIDEGRASYLMASLVKGIEFCRQNKVAHRDIKLSNLAFDHCRTRDGQVLPILKLADFGMAAMIKCDGKLTGRCGTPGFVAPEILMAGKGDPYSCHVDMFSAGVVMYTMLCGYEPFFGVTDEELILANKSVRYDFDEPEWVNVSKDAKNLIEWMMEKDPEKRAKPHQALVHPFLFRFLRNARRFTNSNENGKEIHRAIDRDIPLVVIPRQLRRQNCAQSRNEAGNAKANIGGQTVRTTSLPSKISLGLIVGSISGSIVWFYVLDDDVKTKVRHQLNQTPLGELYRYSADKIADWIRPITDPSRSKLLPDWPIPQVPPNTPPVPVLVLDLEDTLVHSEWSRKHGWRHAKRPGVDEFLETLCQFYEIVIFSENYMAEEIVMKLDPKQCVLHVLSRDATRYLNGSRVKDLSKLNRDLKQVVLLDDDPAAYQLQPENAVPIKPFANARDRDDHELKDLIPFLKALASERVKDFRQVLAEFRDEDGVLRDLPSKYGARLYQLEKEKEQAKQKGFGGFIRVFFIDAKNAIPFLFDTNRFGWSLEVFPFNDTVCLRVNALFLFECVLNSILFGNW